MPWRQRRVSGHRGWVHESDVDGGDSCEERTVKDSRPGTEPVGTSSVSGPYTLGRHPSTCPRVRLCAGTGVVHHDAQRASLGPSSSTRDTISGETRGEKTFRPK